jgi:hypothetical protein
MEVPKLFCWSRVEAEAGEALDTIILRKEKERVQGNGFFYWGVGNSLLGYVDYLSEHTGTEVLFSQMKSKAQKIDHSPKRVVRWQRYVDPLSGDAKELPDFAQITSRAETISGAPKAFHYALVCYSKNSLFRRDHRKVYPDELRNFGGEKKRIGFSQVTALVTSDAASSRERDPYEVLFSATLEHPYFVKLIDPIPTSNVQPTSSKPGLNVSGKVKQMELFHVA